MWRREAFFTGRREAFALVGSGQARPCIFGLLCVAQKAGDTVEELAEWIELRRDLSAGCRHFKRQSCIGIEAGSVSVHFVGKRRDAGDESLADIGRSYNVSAATISRLAA